MLTLLTWRGFPVETCFCEGMQCSLDKILPMCSEKVNCCVPKANQKLVNEAFCAIAKLVMSAKRKEDVLTLFDVLQDEASISSIHDLQLSFSDEHYTVVTQAATGQQPNHGFCGGLGPSTYRCSQNTLQSCHRGTGIKLHKIQMELNRQIVYLRVVGTNNHYLLPCSHYMRKTKCLLYSILLKMGQKPHIGTHQRKCAVHSLVQEGNDNSIVQIKDLILDHQARLSIVRHILVVIKMWNLCPKQRKEKVMIKRMLKYCMKMECGVKDGCLPLISVDCQVL